MQENINYVRKSIIFIPLRVFPSGLGAACFSQARVLMVSCVELEEGFAVSLYIYSYLIWIGAIFALTLYCTHFLSIKIDKDVNAPDS